jgi:hypothetical protein
VPLTAGVSGVVFLAGIYCFGGSKTWREEPFVLGAWGLLYLGEWGWRRATGRWPAGSVEGDPEP